MITEQIVGIYEINMTDYELSLFIPYLLSRETDLEDFENPSELLRINEFYNQAMYNEFRLNNRNKDFLRKLADVIIYFSIISRDLRTKKIQN